LTQVLIDLLGNASSSAATRALAAITLGVMHADRRLLEEKAVLDRPLFEYTRVHGQVATKTTLSLGGFWCLGREVAPDGKPDPRVVDALRRALDYQNTISLEARWMGAHQLDLDLGMLLSPQQARTWEDRRRPWEPKSAVQLGGYPVSTVAALALILIGDRESASRIPAAAGGIDSSGYAANVVGLAHYLGWASVVPALAEVVRAQGTRWLDRLHAIDLLGRLKEGADVLGALLADRQRYSKGIAGFATRREAIGALAEIGGPGVVGYLAAAMGDEKAEMREAAAWALGESGDPAALPHLTAALEDKKKAVRKAAAAAIAKLAH